ncbi:MAG TPA: hypothetical protein VFT01_08185 [Homoserinimonas sp.]|nr:hypothetical protein [Homoserinimonas sp.]
MNAKHRSGDEPVPDDASDAEKPRRRIRRRVSTEPAPGTDPHPAPEPRRHASGENDDQLKRDVPPHWG